MANSGEKRQMAVLLQSMAAPLRLGVVSTAQASAAVRMLAVPRSLSMVALSRPMVALMRLVLAAARSMSLVLSMAVLLQSMAGMSMPKARIGEPVSVEVRMPRGLKSKSMAEPSKPKLARKPPRRTGVPLAALLAKVTTGRSLLTAT